MPEFVKSGTKTVVPLPNRCEICCPCLKNKIENGGDEADPRRDVRALGRRAGLCARRPGPTRAAREVGASETFPLCVCAGAAFARKLTGA
jgi:hypothetical protein